MQRFDDEPKRQGMRLQEYMTLEEIADCLNCTRERVRQIERKALRKLKHQLRKRGIDIKDLIDYEG